MPLFNVKNPLRLYKGDSTVPSRDTRFISGLAREHIQIGGATMYVWLYKGFFDQSDDKGGVDTATDQELTADADNGLALSIQDVHLGEVRDRRYADDAVHLVGTYQVSANSADYARFGYMMGNDRIQVDFHKEDMERQCGRRVIPGDVFEMPHLRDVDLKGRVGNRWYEVESIIKQPTSWDHTWNWHVLTVTMKPIKDSQEFLDLMEREDEYGRTLSQQTSNRPAMEAETAAIQRAAAEQVATTWWDTTPIFIDPNGETSKPAVVMSNITGRLAGFFGFPIIRVGHVQLPVTPGLDDLLVMGLPANATTGVIATEITNVGPNVWTDDSYPPNGLPYTDMIAFPPDPVEGQYVRRIDFAPNRLYRYQMGRWLLKEIDHKREWSPYNWVAKLREFMSDRSEADNARPYELKSVHDVETRRQRRSKPSPRDDR